jgi:hypothetical protein
MTMSKHINVNPDHYKLAGRERQGENVVHQRERQAYAHGHRAEGRGQPRTAGPRAMRTAPVGISNRESAEGEAREREALPPIDTSSPPPEDAAGRTGEQPLEDRHDRHTSHKAGSRSIAQKEDRARYPDRSMPPARKVPGAFGREPRRER